MTEPPPFQEAARCDVCKCSFNTFRRRHHCRCCGRTLCHDHSSNQMPLPQFGLHSNVRVCHECFNNSSRSGNDNPKASSFSVDTATEKFSRLDVTEDADIAESTASVPILNVPECKCGMPLCICEAPAPTAPADPAPLQKPTTSTAQSNPRPKKAIHRQQDPVMRAAGSGSNSKQSVFFNSGQPANGTLDKPSIDYEVNGEGLREAIKNHDASAVKKLLSEGVDPNYCDKQRSSLLHLAALFNQTEIAFILMDHGASLDCKNAQGETPLDCAPTMLQYKMRTKVEEGA